MEEIKLPDGKITDQQKTVVVLVIGESARKANFQLYGYKRNTNPLLSKQERLKVFEATSCATYTTAGTKAILEPQNSDDLYELLPNYAFRMGVDVSWRTSNWGEPPIHIDEYIVNEKLGEIFQEVFDDESIKLEPTTNSADIEEWDSLAQISIVVAVQDEFGISLNVNEATSLHNVGEMVDLILSKLN